MHNNLPKQPVGSLRISRDVIATIASNTAREVEGVQGLIPFSLKLSGWTSKNQLARGVVIDLVDDIAVIDIRVTLKQGARIPDVAGQIQVAVKEAVQSMTGIAVSKVNVTVAGVAFEPQTPVQKTKIQ